MNVVFLGGAEFDRAPPLGDTGRSRYVKVKTLEEAELPEMQDWIEQGGAGPELEVTAPSGDAKCNGSRSRMNYLTEP